MCCIDRPEAAMATTQLTRAPCYKVCWSWQEEQRAEHRPVGIELGSWSPMKTGIVSSECAGVRIGSGALASA
jgi:hypothetical protein